MKIKYDHSKKEPDTGPLIIKIVHTLEPVTKRIKHKREGSKISTHLTHEERKQQHQQQHQKDKRDSGGRCS